METPQFAKVYHKYDAGEVSDMLSEFHQRSIVVIDGRNAKKHNCLPMANAFLSPSGEIESRGDNDSIKGVDYTHFFFLDDVNFPEPSNPSAAHIAEMREKVKELEAEINKLEEVQS